LCELLRENEMFSRSNGWQHNIFLSLLSLSGSNLRFTKRDNVIVCKENQWALL
jgi:hypothetical protein